MAMENGQFIDDFPTKAIIHRGFSIAMFDYQRVDLDELLFHSEQPRATRWCQDFSYHARRIDHAGNFFKRPQQYITQVGKARK